jgi:transposase
LQKLVAETAVAKKQQLTAQRAFELLQGKKGVGGYTLVKELMAERRRAAAEVFAPLEYKPGVLAEVDFFEVEVDVDGVRTTAFLFLMRLMSSSRDFVWLYPRQDQVCFLDGHARAFAHFGGVVERAAYDNLKPAVKKHLVGSDRELTDRMAAMTRHYLVEALFCRPYTGHDKGGVEARGKNVRLQSMVPVPSGMTLDDISQHVLDDVERRYWSKDKSESRWALERAALHALPRLPFDARKTSVSVPVSSRSLVTVEGAIYSVPSSWARRSVTTHAGVFDIEMVGPQGTSVVRRRVPKGQTDVDYAAHYLEVLSTKPQAVRQVADTLVAQLGAPFPDWWQRFVVDDGPRDASRKMARILRGILDLGREECERRVTQALVTGESVAIALLVPVAVTSTTASSRVPAAFDVAVESSSVTSFDALLLPMTKATTTTGGAA